MVRMYSKRIKGFYNKVGHESFLLTEDYYLSISLRHHLIQRRYKIRTCSVQQKRRCES